MNKMLFPNQNADAYRNMTAADRPSCPDNNLQFILVYNENNAILGGSSMTDRYWSGTIWYYNDISSFNPDLATKVESGVCDGAYLEQDKFICGEDSGVLQVFGLIEVDDTHVQDIQCLGYACQHDDSLLTLAAFSDKVHAVTGGMDCCLKVWDTTDLISTHVFNFAHTDVITGVDVQLEDYSVFASASLDGEALMWDVRQSKPAHSILRKDDHGLTAISWGTKNLVAVGADDGSITLLDVRGTGNSVVSESVIFCRPVHKLLFSSSSERSEQLACCCDDNVIKVLDTSKDFAIVYKDETHTDFVRGLAWTNDGLFSCSWDGTIQKHIVQSCKD